MKVHQHILYLNGEKQEPVLRVEALGCRVPGGDIWAVDGGLRHVPPPVLETGNFGFVGDGDSVGAGFLSGRLPRVMTMLSPDKDLSDLASVLDQLKETVNSDEAIRLDVFCGLGGRLDHEWANIAEVARLIASVQGRSISVLHPGVVIASCPFIWHTEPGTIFTLVNPLPGAMTIRVEGARWNGNVVLDRPSKGLSNVVLESPVSIRPERGTMVILMTESEFFAQS